MERRESRETEPVESSFHLYHVMMVFCTVCMLPCYIHTLVINAISKTFEFWNLKSIFT